MNILHRLLQAIGLILVGMAFWHGMFDHDMWRELWYFLAGAGAFYGSGMLVRRSR